ncbi:MAG TPA: amidohydrolase family protein, partial [Chloroflexota bacterium]
MAWQSAIDVDNLTAIDIHVHAGVSSKAPPQTGSAGPTRDDTLARMTQRSGAGGQTPDETAEYYRQRKLACAMWGTDAGGTRPARPGAVSNDEMLEAAARHPDVFIPFVWVDVWRDRAGADEAERLIKAGARGFKFHPPSGGYYANDQRLYPLYEVIAAARLPALFHTGQTAV